MEQTAPAMPNIVSMNLPAILNIPKKLYPFITDFNNFTYFIFRGGRSSAKSHTIARFILYLCSIMKLNVACTREHQKNIELSVYKLLKNYIEQYKLDYLIYSEKIIHRQTGSEIHFMGLSDLTADGIKSLEDFDLVWVEEAQTLSEKSFDILLPTIRKENSKIIFSMNPYYKDVVYEELKHKKNTKIYTINYNDNEFCPKNIIQQAEDCKREYPDKYNHIWLGQEILKPSDYMFADHILKKSQAIEYFDDMWHIRQRILTLDVSGEGADYCVAKCLDRMTHTIWKDTFEDVWKEKDTEATIGKIIQLIKELKPTIVIIDANGMGWPIYCAIKNYANVIVPFKGQEKAVGETSGNKRADGFLDTKDMLEKGYLDLKDRNSTILDLEDIKKINRRNGLIYIEDKHEMRKRLGRSPDRADALSMGCYAIRHCLHMATEKNQNNAGYGAGNIRRKQVPAKYY